VTSLWTVARVDTAGEHITDEQRAEALAWVQSFVPDFRQLTPWLAVSQDEHTKAYRLHLSRFALDADGQKIPDHALKRFHTEPLTFPITTWPGWLADVWQQQIGEH
jgi:hypothetical protein